MAEVLIFEDDPQIGDLMATLLRSRGLTVSHYLSGAGALQLVQENKPRLVVLDIMMPGMDGLTVCRTLKSNPVTRGVKISIVTAKIYKEDREAAARYGADEYLTKPFGASHFETAMSRLLGAAPARPSGGTPPAPPLVASIVPGAFTLESPGLWLLFDAGAGLSSWMGKRPQPAALAWLLLSRYQREAVCDIAAARVILASGGRLNLAGPDDPEASLQKLGPQVCASLPAGTRAMPLLYPLREGEFPLGSGMRAMTCYTQHPGTCLAYRVELQGRSIVYCPAHEIVSSQAQRGGHELDKFRRLFKGADVLLHGYRRSLSDPPPAYSLGRGAWEPVVDLAVEAGVRALVLLPQGGVVPAEGLLARVLERVAKKNSSMLCQVSRLCERIVL